LELGAAFSPAGRLGWVPFPPGLGVRTRVGRIRTRLSVGTNSPSILIVEDDESIATMYRLQLELEGYAVRVASSVSAAQASIMATGVDLLLLDVGLPGADGFELLIWMAHNGHDFPVLLLSNYSSPDLVERARKLGVVDYRIKSHTTPVDLAQIVATILARSG